jgi:hypothetical protein
MAHPEVEGRQEPHTTPGPRLRPYELQPSKAKAWLRVPIRQYMHSG